jgi:hypothetical protein
MPAPSGIISAASGNDLCTRSTGSRSTTVRIVLHYDRVYDQRIKQPFIPEIV